MADTLRCQRCGTTIEWSMTTDTLVANRRRTQLAPDGQLLYAETIDAVLACSWGCLAVLAAQHADGPSTEAAVRVLAERERQRTDEGYSPERDTGLPPGELAQAGAAYALARFRGAGMTARPAPTWWPWDVDMWKPKDLDRDLVRGAALIAAEVDRAHATPPPVDDTPF